MLPGSINGFARVKRFEIMHFIPNRKEPHLSFTRAAEELHLTQSAVSKQVAQLEEMLCHNLFERVRQRLYLSPAGSLYLSPHSGSGAALRRRE